MTSETPPQVAQTAAITDALPMNELALIGLFNKPDGSTALIRTARGAIITLTEGHQTDGYAITAINEVSVAVRDPRGAQHVLQMPG